ncbi:helix-turn-helix domain-containing protein [Saccharibacillus qingshengii]|uniref:helix-turn-helix domain-containing protein n=1 Tax=Saccharibacillus qingshengii TaxID=1763540 RepID=UPI001555D855|nr:AraC family transcriptional regulator [Saccharibacillus qingshengii]
MPYSLDAVKIPIGFWKRMQQINVSPLDIVRTARLPVTLISDTSTVTTAQYFTLWQVLSDSVRDSAVLVLDLMVNRDIAQLPPSVLAAYHARDYRDALSRLTRYKQMCAPERFLIVEKDEYCTIEFDWLYAEKPVPAMLAVGILITLLELGRHGTKEWIRPHLVELEQSLEPVHSLEKHFGCPVRTGAEHNRLTLYRKDLDLYFNSYNAELLEILTPTLERMLDEQQQNSSLTQTVKWMIKRNLSAGRPDIQLVSSELGLSDRTLQRRLTDEGTGFKQLVTEARHEQAQSYLTDPMLDIKEVAFLLGYEDQNSFYRAFRVWEGDTPSNWRAGQLNASNFQNDNEAPNLH